MQTQLIDFMNDRQQTELIFIDFSKAFDTVPHIRLHAINKLKFMVYEDLYITRSQPG